MPNKQIAVGARTKVLMDVETSYGVAPTTPGGVLLPINSFSLKPSRAKNTPGTLTGRYDPAEPFDGNLEVSGGVVVPVDARAFGHWLRAMFGAPATTGTGEPAAAPFTHVWKSNKDMPSLVMQATYGDIYGQFVGCKVSSRARCRLCGCRLQRQCPVRGHEAVQQFSGFPAERRRGDRRGY